MFVYSIYLSLTFPSSYPSRPLNFLFILLKVVISKGKLMAGRLHTARPYSGIVNLFTVPVTCLFHGYGRYIYFSCYTQFST